MRIICDTLTTFVENTRHLVLRFSCFCSLSAREACLAETALLDIFEPLHRLSVANPVTFVIDHIAWQCDHAQDPRMHGPRNSPFHPSKTAQLEKTLQAEYGRLEGLTLSPQEETWKSVKMKNCSVDMPHIVFPCNLPEPWHDLDRDPELFIAKARRYQEEKTSSYEERVLLSP